MAEDYLEPLRRDGTKLRRMRVELREERESAAGLTGIDYTRPAVAASPYGDAVPDAVARVAELEDAYQAALDDLNERRDEARERIDEMGGRSADLLRLRYVSALPWITVAEGMGLAEGTVRNMRVDALSRFYDFLPHTARPPEQGAFPEKI